jgi:nicotinate-nucleotide--dimethylbenzimidazole phosphoribosyltransferase
VVNVGVSGDVATDTEPLEMHPAIRYHEARIRAGTRNLAHEPALTSEEFVQAMEVGKREAEAAAQDGVRVVLVGEMGIGNTTPASCLAVLLANVPVVDAVGRGAGADDATLARKRAVVQAAVERSRQSWVTDPMASMAGVAGLEFAAMAGFYMAAHCAGLTILLDGFVTSAAALIAEQLQPGTSASMIAAHLSAERGHGFVLEHLGLHPFLEWNMRLGEGTGALLLLPLLDAAAGMTCDMATLESLGAPVP